MTSQTCIKMHQLKISNYQ